MQKSNRTALHQRKMAAPNLRLLSNWKVTSRTWGIQVLICLLKSYLYFCVSLMSFKKLYILFYGFIQAHIFETINVVESLFQKDFEIYHYITLCESFFVKQNLIWVTEISVWWRYENETFVKLTSNLASYSVQAKNKIFHQCQGTAQNLLSYWTE